MVSDPPALTVEDQALLDRVARRVLDMRMEVPAILTLETARPLSVIAGQALIFFEPLAQSILRFPDYRRFAALVERRDALEALIQRIEAGAAADRAKRDAARRAAGGRRD